MLGVGRGDDEREMYPIVYENEVLLYNRSTYITIMNDDEQFAFGEAQRSRELGFLDELTYSRFTETLIAIAGLGSVGSETAIALAKAGFRLNIGDPDVVEPSNIARQYYFYSQIGRNKAYALQDNLAAINPFLQVTAFPNGLTRENVSEFTHGAQIIFDGIDLKALPEIYALHENARLLSVPVIMGLDLAGTALVQTYRYDLYEDLEPLGGAYSEEDIIDFVLKKQMVNEGSLSEAEFINYIYGLMPRLINIRDIPYEQLYEAISREVDDGTIYQSPHTPRLLSALVVEVARRISLGQEVKEIIKVDIPSEVRPFRENLTIFFKKAGLFGKVLLRYNT